MFFFSSNRSTRDIVAFNIPPKFSILSSLWSKSGLFLSVPCQYINSVLDLLEDYGLFVFSPELFFFIYWPFAFQVCLNHFIRLFMINAWMFGLLYNFWNFSFVFSLIHTHFSIEIRSIHVLEYFSFKCY